MRASIHNIFHFLSYSTISRSLHFQILVNPSSSIPTSQKSVLSPTRQNLGHCSFPILKSSSTNGEYEVNSGIDLSISRNSVNGNDRVNLIFDGYSKTKSKNRRIQDNLKSFERDIYRAFTLKEGPDPTDIAFIAKNDLSYTKLWTSEMWNKHNSRTRFIRHCVGIPSSRLLRRISPQLMVLVGWSIFVTIVSAYSSINGSVGRSLLSVPMLPLSLISTFVAALLMLRSNQGLTRLNEARVAWGRALLLTRDTAQLLSSYVYPANTERGLLAARHLSIFVWLLKCRLRDEDDTDLVDTVLSHPYSTYVKTQRKKPVSIVSHIRQMLSQLFYEGQISSVAHRCLETNLLELNRVYGICERLRGSPIPPVYTSHTSRLLMFYLFLLPCALLDMIKRKYVIVMAVAMIGFAMLGLDEISHLLEQPFRVIPMQPMANGAMRDVADAFICRPPFEGGDYEEMKEKPSYW